MQQTKPLFIIRKYRSILLAAIIVESVSYIVSLTDSIVAGNALGGPAFSAIGLLAPFLSVSTFISSVVNSGTIMNYSYQIGSFDKRRTMEFFSQGIFMALLAGTVYAGILFACRDFILMRITGSELIRQYALDYYNTIIPIFILNPLSCLLDNMVIADGEERLSAGANVIQIVLNVLLSVLFVGNLGIKGVALASVLSKFLFVLIICFHFLSRKNTLQLIRYWKNRDRITIIRSGVVKASTFALEGLMVFLVNLFAIHYFDANTLILPGYDEGWFDSYCADPYLRAFPRTRVWNKGQPSACAGCDRHPDSIRNSCAPRSADTVLYLLLFA